MSTTRTLNDEYFKASQIILREYRGAENFVTPKVLGYALLSSTAAAELSSGEAFTGRTVYGVSIAVIDKTKSRGTRRVGRDGDPSGLKSGVFGTRKEAEAYIEAMKLVARGAK